VPPRKKTGNRKARAPQRRPRRRGAKSPLTPSPRRPRGAGKSRLPRAGSPVTPDAPLLALSRDLAQARTEDQITAALGRALEALFPGRSFAIRLVDPKTLALRTLHARGRLRPGAPVRIALRQAVLDRAGLAAELVREGAVAVADVDAPLFEGSEAASAVPLAVGGQLFGVVNLEYEPGQSADPARDGPLLDQLANHAALGVRNVRSIEELTYLKTYLENLVEHANALVLVVNRCREVVVWNAALVRTTGLERDRVVGDDLLAFVPPEERAGLEEVLLRGFAGEATDGYETRLVRAGGGDARIAINTAPLVGPSGEVDDVIAIGQDLTLVRSLQAAAEHAERLAGIGRLVAGVVHELNNPLTAVNMYSDALVEKLSHAGHDAADLEKLRAIHESGQRIQRLARDLVAYARPAGARTEPVELAGVIEEAARLAKPALKEHGAFLDTRVAPAPPVEGSRASLVQVVVNLVTNAAQAVADGGHVSVTLAPEGRSVRLTVEDDGAGMPSDVAGRAFEPFFTTRPARGIGLGLPIVQGIVERHGGTVALDTAPGKGTRVNVVLPVKTR
jgi:two-component system, NtrC family, sensor kinase